VDGEAPVQEDLSSNPEIARAQKEFYSKTQEVAREKRWVAEVRRIIDEYNGKIRNVQRHTQITEAELRKSRKTIVTMIKASKQAKLEKELQAALESLKKLESTSLALNGKMSELTQTKLGLKATIGKIQQVITHSSRAGSAVMMQLQEAVKPTSDELRLMEQEAANQGAKTLFGSLIQLVNEAHGRHQMHHQARVVAKATKATKPEPEALLSDADISVRAAAIAAKYADEENQRLHTNLPLRALAVTDLESDSDLE
jgi:predicted  nucleic acid-binding Zn-ribbon protein